MFSGEFEVHLTGSEWEAAELAAFAQRRGAKFSHIQLDRGATPSQPMLTVPGRGTLAQVRELAERWRTDLHAAELRVLSGPLWKSFGVDHAADGSSITASCCSC